MAERAHRMKQDRDRAPVVVTAIFQVLATTVPAWPNGDPESVAAAHAEAVAILREEFHEIQRQTLTEIRLTDG